jgi:hypothetical protein
MKVLVCGGRNYSDYGKIYDILDEIHEHEPITKVIHGTASGADDCGKTWANSRGIKEDPYPPDWKKYGLAAGPIRNQQMIDEGQPDLVIAFPGGKGTKDMITKAEKAGILVKKVD